LVGVRHLSSSYVNSDAAPQEWSVPTEGCVTLVDLEGT
jgi:hypothetical protein